MATCKSEKENKKENNFGDFFNCSGKNDRLTLIEIDFQNNSQFMNDQSEIIIDENGEKETPKSRKESNNDSQVQQQNDKIILQELQEQVVEDIVVSDNHIAVTNPDIVEKESSEQVMSPTLQIAQTRNIRDQNSGSFRRKTKEQMLIEPLPVFDCMFCVSNEKFVLQKILEISLHKKYQSLGTELAEKRISDVQNQMTKFLLGSSEGYKFITMQEEEDEIQETYLKSQLALQIMINQNPNLRQHLDEELDTIHDFSPIMQRKMSNQTLSNFSQFIPHPQLQVERSAFDQKKCFIKIKIAQIMSQSRRKSQSGETFENNYATSPTFLGNELGINTLLFNSKQDKKIADGQPNQSIQLHEIKTSEPLLNLDDMMDEPIFEKVNIYKWARNRRQKVINDISFDSDIHNIYNPKYSSDEEDSFDISLLREENQEIKITHDKSSDSNMSIAEERDTISLSANAITPNLSRVINNCSISKMEQQNLLNVISSHYSKIQESQRQSRYTQPVKKQKKEIHAYQVRSYAESVITQERNSSPKESQSSQQQSLRPRSFLKHESISSISSFANNISSQGHNQNQLYIQLLKPFLNRQKQKVKIKSKRNEPNTTAYINNPSRLMLSSQNNQSQNQNVIYKSHIVYNDTSNTVEPFNSIYSTPLHDRYKKNTVNDKVKKEGIKPRTKSLLKNSQSHSNLTIQPRAFITRNVKIRQSNMGINDPIFNESPNQKQSSNQRKLVFEQNKSPTQQQFEQKVDFRLQNKRQKLQRDILLSKVYTHGQQLPPSTATQHKKNKSINPNFEQIRSSGQQSKLSLQYSKQKSSLQLDPLNQLKSKQSMKQLPSTTKSYKSPIDSIKMPAINNFLK